MTEVKKMFNYTQTYNIYTAIKMNVEKQTNYRKQILKALRKMQKLYRCHIPGCPWQVQSS